VSNKMERFTQRARRVLSLAQEEAERMQHSYIGTEHLLLGLMREDGGVAGRVLRELGLDPNRVEQLVEKMTSGQKRAGVTRMDLAPATKKVLELAVDEARRMGHHYIGTEHLLLGLVRHSEGVAMDVFRELKISPDEIRRQTKRMPPEEAPDAALARLARRSVLPRILLRLEGAALFAAAIALYADAGWSWLAFVGLLIAPDISLVGYALNPRLGAYLYNAVHFLAVPVALGTTALLAGWSPGTQIALVWVAHIGIDRAFGLGLKYPDSARDTHLQRL